MRNIQRAAGPTRAVPRVSEQDICDAYLYLLGRLLVLREEHHDFRTVGGIRQGGYRWNELVHRELGGNESPPPIVDVAFSEAWIAMDDTSCTLLDIPPMGERYFTIQAVNLWGETLVNINERNYPGHPSGSFAFCPRGAKISLPRGTVRVEVPCRKARLFIRIGLGDDAATATALQHMIKLRASGTPRISSPITIPAFTNEQLPGVEAFDPALAVIASEPDFNPGAGPMQALVRAVVAVLGNGKTERDRVQDTIRTHAWPKLQTAIAAVGQQQNGWARPRVIGNYGSDWLTRTIANLGTLWGNAPTEVVAFENGHAAPLRGGITYSMTFAKEDLPAAHVDYFWSIACVDANDQRVVTNAKERFALTSQSPLVYNADGSLTLYFAPDKPPEAADVNWLPTPAEKSFVLMWRSYGPDQATIQGRWFPPALKAHVRDLAI